MPCCWSEPTVKYPYSTHRTRFMCEEEPATSEGSTCMGHERPGIRAYSSFSPHERRHGSCWSFRVGSLNTDANQNAQTQLKLAPLHEHIQGPGQSGSSPSLDDAPLGTWQALPGVAAEPRRTPISLDPFAVARSELILTPLGSVWPHSLHLLKKGDVSCPSSVDT